MAAIDLTTLDRVKFWLKLSSTADDTLLTQLITDASYTFLSETQRGSQELDFSDSELLGVQSYSETYDGTNTPILVLRHYPVKNVSVVTISGVVIPLSPDGVQYGYRFDRFSLKLVGFTFTTGFTQVGFFTRGYLNIAVSYTAGYTSVPGEVQRAVDVIVAAWYRRSPRIDLVSETLEGQVRRYSDLPCPKEAQAVIDRWRRRIAA